MRDEQLPLAELADGERVDPARSWLACARPYTGKVVITGGEQRGRKRWPIDRVANDVGPQTLSNGLRVEQSNGSRQARLMKAVPWASKAIDG